MNAKLKGTGRKTDETEEGEKLPGAWIDEDDVEMSGAREEVGNRYRSFAAA